ncbi:MAG: Ig-like domain-containing protein [Acholeplasmataceae bacterium]|jgi:hypothetical protein
MKKILTFLLLVFSLGTVTVMAAPIGYNGPASRTKDMYKDAPVQIIHETANLSAQENIGELGLTTVGPGGGKPVISYHAKIVEDAALGQNVLELFTKNEDGTGGGRFSNTKTGVISDALAADDASTGNHTALHLKFNAANPKMMQFYVQGFLKEGGKGSTVGIGNIIQVKWVSGQGTSFYFGSAETTAVIAPKKWDGFVLNTWYDLVVVFEDLGAKDKDKVTYYLDGVKMHEHEGLNVNFNKNIQDIQIGIQGNNTDTSTLKIAHLYGETWNPIASVEAGSVTSIVGGQTAPLLDVVNPIGSDATKQASLAEHVKVEIAAEHQDKLKYNSVTKMFEAQAVAETATVPVTVTSSADPAVTATLNVEVTAGIKDVVFPIGYNGPETRFRDMYNEAEVQELFISDNLPAGNSGINKLGLTTVNPSTTGSGVEYHAKIVEDASLNQNVLELFTKIPSESGSRWTQTKTGIIADALPVDSTSTGNHTAIHFKFNSANPKAMQFYVQAYIRDGGKVNGSNKNIGNLFQCKWEGAENFYFGNKDNAVLIEAKLWAEFTRNTWHELVIVLLDLGDATEDQIVYYMNGIEMHRHTGLAFNFNKNVSDLMIGLQGNNKDTNTLKIAHLYGETWNPIVSIAPSVQSEIKSGQSAPLFNIVKPVGEDADHKATLADYVKVEIPETHADKLTYNATTRRFEALAVAADTVVPVTVTSSVDPTVTKVINVTVKTAVVMPAEVAQKVILENYKMTVGETFQLDNLFEVLPEAAANKDLTFTVTGTSVQLLEGNVLKAVSKGTATLTATSDADPEVKKEVTVVVNDGEFTALNQFQLETKWAVADPAVVKDGYSARGYGSKAFGSIEVVADPVFGNVVKIISAGEANNAGGAYLRGLFDKTLLTPNKDYVIRAYVKYDGSAIGSPRVDLKNNLVNSREALIADIKVEERFNLSALNGNNWVLVEIPVDKSLNLDTEAGGHAFSIELVTYNTKEGIDIYIAHPQLVQLDTVRFVDFTLADTELTMLPNGTHTVAVEAVVPSAYEIPADGLTITSDAPAIVKVEGKVLTALAHGSANITVSHGGKEKIIAVTVINPMTKVAVDKATLEVVTGALGEVSVTITPAESNDTLLVENSAPTIVTAAYNEETGKLNVTALKDGTATITLKAKSNPAVSTQVVVTVTKVEATGIALADEDLNPVTDSLVLQKDSEKTLFVTIVPANATDKIYTVESLNTALVTVNKVDELKFEVTGVAGGVATVKVTSGNIVKEIAVTVKEDLDLTTINAKITAAEAKLEGVVKETTLGEASTYATGTKHADKVKVEALEAKITAAKALRNTANTQAEINTMATELDTMTTQLTVVVGTKAALDYSELQTLITAAQTVLNSAETIDDITATAADILLDKKVVLTAEATRLSQAIATAEGQVNNLNSDTELATAIADLTAAKTRFEGKIIVGTKPLATETALNDELTRLEATIVNLFAKTADTDLNKEYESSLFMDAADVERIKAAVAAIKVKMQGDLTADEIQEIYDEIIGLRTEIAAKAVHGNLDITEKQGAKRLSPIAIVGFVLLGVIIVGFAGFAIFRQVKVKKSKEK